MMGDPALDETSRRTRQNPDTAGKKKGECPQGSDEAYEEEHETAEVGEPT